MDGVKLRINLEDAVENQALKISDFMVYRKSFSCLDFLIFLNHFDIENAWNEYQVAWMCREIEREV